RKAALACGAAVAAAVVAATTGCATPDRPGSRPWKVEPVFNVNHSTQSSQAYYALGQYHDGSMAWDQAIAAYRKAIAADATNLPAYDALGVALAQAGRLAEAEVVLRQAVALAPDRPRIRNNLGYVLLLAGKTDEAVVVLKSVVEQDGGNAIARANLSDALARSKGPADTDAATVAAAEAAPSEVSRPTPIPVATLAPDVPAALAVPAPTDRPTQTPPAARLEVSNGNGIAGMAARVGRWLASCGVPAERLTNRQPYTQRYTIVQYRSGQEQAARQVARLLPADAQTETQPTPGLRSDVRVVLGRDWTQVAACLEHGTCRTPASAIAMAAAPVH
ncbi:MAG TPA: LytR C-terminal domain-containing protein, partial [Burkholderiaceae bacterium]|nr:LytR C-terminal domain-containing protein [Burkholderiaceae bacterium]